jgi:hypothetical protein
MRTQAYGRRDGRRVRGKSSMAASTARSASVRMPSRGHVCAGKRDGALARISRLPSWSASSWLARSRSASAEKSVFPVCEHPPLGPRTSPTRLTQTQREREGGTCNTDRERERVALCKGAGLYRHRRRGLLLSAETAAQHQPQTVAATRLDRPRCPRSCSSCGPVQPQWQRVSRRRGWEDDHRHRQRQRERDIHTHIRTHVRTHDIRTAHRHRHTLCQQASYAYTSTVQCAWAIIRSGRGSPAASRKAGQYTA